MKYVVCYSGGHSSGLCAIAAVHKHGRENVILLNHDITSVVEDSDIKRFKTEVAAKLGLEITYANHQSWETATPIQVCVDASAWKVGNGQNLCTNRLKTAPFNKWQLENDPNKEHVYIYGFDNTKEERLRAQRRSQIMGLQGYKTAFPLIEWDIKIKDTVQLGILPPMGYTVFKHANCTGCTKAGWQHWYIVYCTRRDIWEEGKIAEDVIGYAMHKADDGTPVYLEDKEELFNQMIELGIKPTEHVNQSKFWADTHKAVKAANASKIKICDIEQLQKHDHGVCLECM